MISRGNFMKIFILIITMLPMMAFASETFEFSGEPVTDEELAEMTGGLGNNCAKHSDMWCLGKRPGSFCSNDPRNGRTGTCNQTDRPDSRGNVSCSCF